MRLQARSRDGRRPAPVGALLPVLALAACNAAVAPADIIARRCKADGETAAVCECFGRLSMRDLPPDWLRIVLLGAQEKTEEADAAIAALPAERAMQMHAALDRIVLSCRKE